MWHKEYRDYPMDSPLVKNQVGPSRGIIGCEMHDLNGWGNSLHVPVKSPQKGLFSTLLERFFALFGGSKTE